MSLAREESPYLDSKGFRRKGPPPVAFILRKRFKLIKSYGVQVAEQDCIGTCQD